MASAAAVLLGIIIAVIICRYAVRSQRRLTALLLAAFTIGVVCCLIDVQTRESRQAVEPTNEAVGMQHYANAQKFVTEKKYDQAIQQFELARKKFEPGSKLDRAAQAAILALQKAG